MLNLIRLPMVRFQLGTLLQEGNCSSLEFAAGGFKCNCSVMFFKRLLPLLIKVSAA